MREFSSASSGEIVKPTTLDTGSFDPDKRIDVNRQIDRNAVEEYNVDKKIATVFFSFNESKNSSEPISRADAYDSDYPSSYKDRIDRTPSEQSDRGEWIGERGESTYIPSDEKMKELLAQYGMDGIEYKDGIPDFSRCSECTVEIDNMTENRYSNFAQCDEKCAEQWNKEGRDGKTDWTARDVQKWRSDNGYSWHERNDMKTCDLVPTEVNDYFGHLGGVAECKKRDAEQNIGGDFDE